MAGADRTETVTFGDKLDAIIGVVGYRMSARAVTGVHLAGQVLKITPQQFAKKRTGRAPVSEHEMSKLIDHFQIGGLVDYRIFQQPDVDGVLAALKEASAGTFGASQCHELCQLLFGAPRSGCKVGFSRIVGPFSLRGPFGPPSDRDDGRPILRVGGGANIRCEGPEGCNLIVLSADQGMTVSVLMPSVFAPDTRVPSGTATLPTVPEYDHFKIQHSLGAHRLYALWADDQVAQVVRNGVMPLDEVRTLDPTTAGNMVRLLRNVPRERLRAAHCDFLVC
ncbi:MAG: hypothetical protein J0H08_03435 [Rhizobiales bacterium]|nr:hypothetical protein [Hyphomicrobiales bacterium]